MRHLTRSATLLALDPATGLGRGTIALQCPPGPSWTVDRVQLTGAAPAKAILRDASGSEVGGTRAAEDDQAAGLGLRLVPGQQVTVEVFDGTVGATHQASCWGA